METDGGTAAIRSHSDDPRRTRILEGALKVFLAYGFTRTTMDDIARAAELSRPALYLVFRNKTDIYRAIGSCVLEQCRHIAAEALAGDAPLAERLDAMIERAMFATLKEIEEAPHGPELLDIRNSLAGDLIAEWRTSMDVMVENAIAREAERSGIDLAARGLTARTLAETLLDALEGMRPRVDGPDAHLEAGRRLTRVIVAALRP